MLLNLKDVKKVYKNFELNCSLQLQEGYVVGLIGKNGAGKSTTFNSILNLIKIDDGDIEVFNTKCNELSLKQKEDLGVVMAESCFSSYLCIKDIVPIMASLYHNFNRDYFIDKCNKFDLPLNKKIKEFSTGMKAKLKVLLALSHKAKLLILDEPTAGLDVIAREEVLDLLRTYMEEDDTRGIIISSHISSDLEGICDELYMIDEGKIVLHEDTDVLLSDYAVLKVTEEQYNKIDKDYILKQNKQDFGYMCLTNQKQFYEENYPQCVIEKGNIDEVFTMMIRGK